MIQPSPATADSRMGAHNHRSHLNNQWNERESERIFRPRFENAPPIGQCYEKCAHLAALFQPCCLCVHTIKQFKGASGRSRLHPKIPALPKSRTTRRSITHLVHLSRVSSYFEIRVALPPVRPASDDKGTLDGQLRRYAAPLH